MHKVYQAHVCECVVKRYKSEKNKIDTINKAVSGL